MHNEKGDPLCLLTKCKSTTGIINKTDKSKQREKIGKRTNNALFRDMLGKIRPFSDKHGHSLFLFLRLTNASKLDPVIHLVCLVK